VKIEKSTTCLFSVGPMTSEQAKGKTADKRSDIWSFGVILYQVLTGQRLFPGETAIEILGAMLNRDPDVSAAPRRVHDLLHGAWRKIASSGWLRLAMRGGCWPAMLRTSPTPPPGNRAWPCGR